MADNTENELSTRGERFAWSLFDFANSPFPTIARTAFGAPYFASVLVGEEGMDLGPMHLSGTAAWGLAVAMSMALVTLTGPVLGALADKGGGRKKWLTFYVLLCVAATAGMGMLPAGAAMAAFVLFVLANFAFEGAYVFYNAYLPSLVPPEKVGRLSGQGWALGYLGGLLALVLAKPLIPADFDRVAGPVYLIVAGWYLVFSLPTLIMLKDRPVEGESKVNIGDAFRQVGTTIRSLRHQKNIAFFLLAYFLYTDALTTVIDFTGIFTKETLGFTPGELITLFLVLNVIAAPGAMAFGWLLDRLGGKKSIGLSLVLWLIVVGLTVTAQSKTAFWPAAILAAIVLGGTQASSRAFMAKLSPKERVGEMMGFLALSGKASAIAGPLLYGVVSQSTGSNRIAVGAVGSFFLIALVVLQKVKEPNSGETAAAE